MDRGWHHTTFSGPDRYRLGQEPYDRGRVGSNERRCCFHCGKEGHLAKYCPEQDVRHHDSGRFMERSAGGNGRFPHDSWTSARMASTVGKEHGYSRTESIREGGSSRRSYSDRGDFSQRPRDVGHRHRDNDGKGHVLVELVGAPNANVREKDTKTGRCISLKPVDESQQAGGGNRGPERRDIRGKEFDGNSQMSAVNGDVHVGDPPAQLVSGGEDFKIQKAGQENSRVQKADQEDRLISKISSPDAELVSNGNVAGVEETPSASSDGHVAQQLSRSPNELHVVVPEDSCLLSGDGGERDLKCTDDSETQGRVNKFSPTVKLPLSILCKDAERNSERKYRNGDCVVGTATENPLIVESILPSSVEEVDGEESLAEVQQCIKLGSPPDCQDKEGILKIEDSKFGKSPVNNQQTEREHKDDTQSNEGRVVSEHSEQADVRGVCGYDDNQYKSVKGRRSSRWDNGRDEDQKRDLDKDGHSLVVRDSVSDSDAVQDLGRLSHPCGLEPLDEDMENQLTDLGSGEDGHHAREKESCHVEINSSEHSVDGTLGRVKRRGPFQEGDKEPRLQGRVSEPDCHMRDGDGCRAREGSDRVGERDSHRQHSENMNSSYMVAPMKGRNHSKDRDNSHNSYIDLGNREGSVDRNSDRNGYNRYYGRTGLKDGYRYLDYGINYKFAGRSGLENLSDCGMGEDTRDHRRWGSDGRHPGHIQYYPGSYVSICNARFLQQRMRSPRARSSPLQAVVPLDPFLSSSQAEANNSTMEPQSKGWLYCDPDGKVQGPMTQVQLRELLNSGKIQSDYMVQQEGSHEWVALEHIQSPLKSNVMPTCLSIEQPSETESLVVSQSSQQLSVPASQELSLEEHVNPENADQDICPPGTEACVADFVDEDYEDLHIDERVEKLMDGITLIPGKEKEIVHEALSSAARRVQQEYESDIVIEESPRSHGGFAILGDQWKDGDFGSDVQGFGFDQQARKLDAKVEEAGAEGGSDGGMEVVSAPEPDSTVNCTVNCHAESKQESWKWPSRGGDWKVLYVMDNSQQTRGEAKGSFEKGYLGYPRKVVMNEGFPLCESRHDHARDPRKQNHESGKPSTGDLSRLQVPTFVLKALVSKVESSDDHHTIHNHFCSATPKGVNATTPKSQGSTPCAYLSTPVKGRPVSVGTGCGLKISNSGRSSSTQGLVMGAGSKSLSQHKHQQPLNKGLKVVNVAGKREFTAKRNAGMVDKHGPLSVEAGHLDVQLKPAAEHAIEHVDRKSKRLLQDFPLNNPFPPELQQEVHELDVSNCSNTPSKRHSVNRTFPSREDLALKVGHWYYLDGSGHEVGPFSLQELQSMVAKGKLLEGSSIYRSRDNTWVPLCRSPSQGIMGTLGELVTSSNHASPPHHSKDGRMSCSTGVCPDVASFHDNHPQFLGFARGKLHEYVMKSFKAVFSATLDEGLDKLLQLKLQEKLSTAATVSVSPSFSVQAPSAPSTTLSTVMDLSVTEKCHIEGFAREDTVQHEKQLQALPMSRQSIVNEVSSHILDDGAGMMDVEACDGPASISEDTTLVDGESCLLKRKGPSVDDGESSKRDRKYNQRRRLLDTEEISIDRKPVHSSCVTHVVNPAMPLIDDNLSNIVEVAHFNIQRRTEQNWASLPSSILRMILRSLRGDVMTLVNAMATCKSWLSAGKKCKSEMKQADLSSIQGHHLDAALESLPGFGGVKLRRIILKGCTVSPESLRHLFQACPSISTVEIGSNEPLKELIHSFPKVRWLGEPNGVQSPRGHLSRKREESHLKTKSLKVIGESRDGLREPLFRDGDESEMHLVSDSASKVRSPNGYTCLIGMEVETLISDSVQDSEITHLARGPSDGVKHLKLNNGGMIIKSNGVHGSTKAVRQENGNRISPSKMKRKALAGSSHRKYEKAVYRMSKPVSGGQRALADKHSSTSVKVEHISKSMSSSLFEGDKSLEKEMSSILRLLMDADSDKYFQSANIIATDGKEVSSVSGKPPPDFLMIDKKLKGGSYSGGMGGFKSFKEDVSRLIRYAFRSWKETPVYSTAEKIFKLSHQHFKKLETQIMGSSSTDPHNQGKHPGARSFNRAGKRRVNNLSMLQHHPKNKRKAWDEDGIQKRKYKKVRHGDSSSGDVDSDSDSTEHETRRLPKVRKEQSWESGGDSSEEDEEAAFIEEDEDETETEVSDSDVPSESEGEDGLFGEDNYDTEDEFGYHDWGARMTKAAMVPPVTRKYTVIEEYRIVADKERVQQKMKVELPKDYEKLQAADSSISDSYSHLEVPEMKDYKPRKKLDEEVVEQEVYGIDPYTYNLLCDTMPVDIADFSEIQRQQFIEEVPKNTSIPAIFHNDKNHKIHECGYLCLEHACSCQSYKLPPVSRKSCHLDIFYR